MVSTSGVAPLTVTVSCSDATFSVMLTVSSWPSVNGHAFAHRRGEAGQLGLDGVDARRQRRRAVAALFVGDIGAGPARSRGCVSVTVAPGSARP